MNGDKYVVSIKRIFSLLVALTIAVIFLAKSEYEITDRKNRAMVFDFLVSIASALEEIDRTPLQWRQVADISAKAQQDKLRALMEVLKAAEPTTNDSKIPDDPFDERQVTNAYYLNLATRLSPESSACQAMVFKNIGSRTMWVMTTVKMAAAFNIEQKNFYLLNVSQACPWSYSIGLSSALLLDARSKGVGWFVGLPKANYFSLFGHTRFIGEGGNEQKLDGLEILDFMGTDIKKYATHFPEYKWVPANYIKNLVFAESHEITKSFRSALEFEAALSDVLKFNETQANFGGLSTTGKSVIQISPVIFTVLIYLLYNRIGTLRQHRWDHGEPWIIGDRTTWIDKGASYLVLAIPTISFLTIFSIFSDVFGYRLTTPFGSFSLRNIFGLNEIYAPGIIEIDPYASAIAIVLIIPLFLTYRVTLQLYELMISSSDD